LKRHESRLKGLVVLEPDVFKDSRGFFLETYNTARYHDLGIGVEFVQDNHSRSVRGTIRGLHYQIDPGQPKLVRVAHGSAWDVVLDIRRSSSTYGLWDAFELDDVSHRQLYVPVGFAHGFCALTDVVDVVYKVGSPYDPSTERGIAWDDPELGIPWPTDRGLVSERDARNPRLRDVANELPDW
jgi:dTDP-4-dehydrorhamnose 3,5-epimerase